jgi:cyclopropane-fatty-acyl-phospholipid synthase
MSSSCIEEVSVRDDNWFRIANELLSRAGIQVNGPSASDIQVKNPDFFKRVLQEGSLGLGESYMDGWWECDRLDVFFTKVLRAGLEKQLPRHLKDTLRIAGARLLTCNLKTRMDRRQRTLRPGQRSFYPHAGPTDAILLRLLERG